MERLEDRHLLAASFLTAGATAMVYDASGALHVAYYDTATRTLKYTARSASGKWDPAVTVDAAPSAGAELSIAIDASGRPGIAYYDAGGRDLKYAAKGKRTWSVSTVDAAGTVGHNPSLAYGFGGRPVISYQATSTSDLRLASYDGRRWQLTTIDSAGSVGRYSQLAVNPVNGSWAIAYESQGDRTIRYAQSSGRSFSTRVLARGGAVTGWVARPSLAFTAAGTPVVSYVDAGTGSVVLLTGGRRTWGQAATAAGAARGARTTLYVAPGTSDPRVVYTSTSGGLALASPAAGGATGLDTVDVGGGQAAMTAVDAASGAVTTFDATGQATVVDSGTDVVVAASRPTASSGGSAHEMQVAWGSVPGAQGYVVERSTAGGAWVRAGSVAGDVLTFRDTGLAENTSYQYRVRAQLVGGLSKASQPSQATTTATFRVFDATNFTGKPQPLAAGVEPIHMEYSVRVDDEAWARQEARTVAATGQMLCLDIETMPLDIRLYPVAAVDDTIARFNRMIGWMRDEEPGLKIGFYWNMPLGAPDDLDDPAQVRRWREADDYLIPRLGPSVDFLCPSLYTATNQDTTTWAVSATATLEAARRYGKPMYCFLMMVRDGAGSDYLPADVWRMEVATVRAQADGAVIWSGFPEPWADAAPTWAGVGSAPTAPVTAAAAPSGLTFKSAGAVLSWKDNSADEAGFVIERSTDGGATFRTAGQVPRDVTTWADPKLSSGTTYVYRVAALTGAGLSAYTANAGGVATRDALLVNEAERYEAAAGVMWHPTMVSHVDAGDYLAYRSVDFGRGADQFRTRVTVPDDYAGQRIQVRLDGVNGPVIGELTVASTGGWYNFVEQTASVARTTGVHDVYLVFRERADGTGGAGVCNMDSWSFGAGTAPAVPTGLTATAAVTGVDLRWADESGDESGFTVERSADGVTYSPVATVGANVTAYRDETAAPGVKYWYRVRSGRAGVLSDPSNVATGQWEHRDGLSLVQAESYDEMSGVGTVGDGNVGFIDGGDWVRYYGMDFGTGGATKFTARIAVPDGSAGQQIEVRLDALDGPVIGTLTTASTGGWYTYAGQTTAVAPTTGLHDVYLVFRGTYGIGNLDAIQFSS